MVELITPGVSRWLASWPSPYPLSTALERIASAQESMREGRSIQYAVERRADGIMIGCVAIKKMPDDPMRADLGYWLGEAYHGTGYATEAAAAAVSVAFETLNVDVIQCGAQPEHSASFGVMRKLGMHAIGEKKIWSSARKQEEVCLYYEVRRPSSE